MTTLLRPVRYLSPGPLHLTYSDEESGTLHETLCAYAGASRTPIAVLSPWVVRDLLRAGQIQVFARVDARKQEHVINPVRKMVKLCHRCRRVAEIEIPLD